MATYLTEPRSVAILGVRACDDATLFSVVDLTDGDRLAGEALLWGIDLHNRTAHLGISLLPEFRGRALGADVARVLCHYGFALRGLNRLQVDTLADNVAMIRAATGVGFVKEGVLRRATWVDGDFLDEVVKSTGDGHLATFEDPVRGVYPSGPGGTCRLRSGGSSAKPPYIDS